MKLLRNKSTGEIGCLVFSFGKTTEKITVVQYIDGKRGSKVWYYDSDSLAELSSEWEGYEEPKEIYYLTERGVIDSATDMSNFTLKMMKQIGNYFETKEEAEKAVEKLKAWKRLKDKGFKFTGYNACSVDYDIDEQYRKYISQDLHLLFGGEE